MEEIEESSYHSLSTAFFYYCIATLLEITSTLENIKLPRPSELIQLC